MPELSRRQVEVTNAFGFHLRAASRFVQLSQQFQVKIRVSCDGRAADGRSILDLIALAAGCGARLELEAMGPDAEEAAAALCALIAAGFHEGDDGRDACPGPRALPASKPTSRTHSIEAEDDR